MAMRCPTCKHETVYQGNPFRPFCSERCQLLDLDNWLSGRYRVPASIESGQELPKPQETAGGAFDEHDLEAGD